MDYNNAQLDEIDKKLEQKWSAKHKLNKIFSLVIILVIILFVKDHVLFHLKFCFPNPSGYETSIIDTNKDPIQIDYSEKQKEQRKFEYKSLINGHIIQVYPQAKYKIAGTVIAYNYTFLIRNDFFDSTALYDLGLSWGQLGDKNFFNKYIKCYSQKTELFGDRVLWTRWKSPNNADSISPGYITTHISHNHIVPANRNIMAALLNIKKWDKVELEGELVNLEYKNKQVHTSLSRSDTEGTTCETVYVTKAKIGNIIYK